MGTKRISAKAYIEHLKQAIRKWPVDTLDYLKDNRLLGSICNIIADELERRKKK